jgi:hypothetical protein
VFDWKMAATFGGGFAPQVLMDLKVGWSPNQDQKFGIRKMISQNSSLNPVAYLGQANPRIDGYGYWFASSGTYGVPSGAANVPSAVPGTHEFVCITSWDQETAKFESSKANGLRAPRFPNFASRAETSVGSGIANDTHTIKSYVCRDVVGVVAGERWDSNGRKKTFVYPAGVSF